MKNKINSYLPSLAQCWVIVFTLIVVGGIGAGTLLSAVCLWIGYDVSDLNPLISYTVPILPVFIYILLSKSNPEETILLEKPDFGSLNIFATYLMMAIATIALGFVSEPLSSWLPMPESIKDVFEKILSNSVWAFITTVVAAPIIEEFLLRGIIERGLLKHTTPAKAILWSSFFFAIIHLNPWQAIGAFIAGVFIGWIYWRTHSLVACIFIHAINNGTAYFIQLLNPGLSPDSTYKDLLNLHSPNLYWTVFVIFAVLLALIMYFFEKKLPKDNF